MGQSCCGIISFFVNVYLCRFNATFLSGKIAEITKKQSFSNQGQLWVMSKKTGFQNIFGLFIKLKLFYYLLHLTLKNYL